MPARNSSRRPGRTSICTSRLYIVRPSVVRLCMQSCIQEPSNEGKRTTMTEERYPPDVLRTFCSRVLESLGVPAADAALVADSLVQADLWGHASHGLLRLPWYAARLRSGAMRAVTEPAVLTDTGPLVLLDGRDGVGQVLTDRARALATDRARQIG